MHPQPKQESIFRPVYVGWLRLEVYLDAILRATTKKKVVNFFGKKVHPRQNPGYAKRLVTLLTYRRYTNIFIYLSIYLSMAWSRYDLNL